MELKYRLLEHPFYKAWNSGAISKEQLAVYAASYNELINKIPDLWKKVIEKLDSGSKTGEHIVNEEKGHIALWEKWQSTLEDAAVYPSMKGLIEELSNMNETELLGAIHAFEIQQPEVAETKKCGLIDYYNADESDLVYFDEHMNEEKHIDYAREISHGLSKIEFERGFEKGSELFYKNLDNFIN